MNSHTPAIACHQLVKSYPGRPPTLAVRGIDLVVERGECFGMLGPNGAGKTTTIEILEGLLEPTSGDVEVLGLKWKSDQRRLREQIGVSLQETRLSEKLTVRETICLFRSFYAKGLDPWAALDLVGLREKAAARVGQVSGGERQRLAVATAIVGWPELVFLDEPTTGLDPQSRRQIWDIVEAFKSQGRTVVLTTHYMDEAERLCDRLAIVDSGKIIATGTPTDLIHSLGGAHMVEVSGNRAEDFSLPIDLLSRLPSVKSVSVRDGVASLLTASPHIVLPPLVAALEQKGYRLTRLTTRQASLDDVFVQLSGRHLNEPVVVA